jgi:hypothetical protein
MHLLKPDGLVWAIDELWHQQWCRVGKVKVIVDYVGE